jgi:hypothetical protein
MEQKETCECEHHDDNCNCRGDNRTPVEKTVKISRNDFCPCGSGFKFKKCCIGKLNNRIPEKFAYLIKREKK